MFEAELVLKKGFDVQSDPSIIAKEDTITSLDADDTIAEQDGSIIMVRQQ